MQAFTRFPKIIFTNFLFLTFLLSATGAKSESVAYLISLPKQCYIFSHDKLINKTPCVVSRLAMSGFSTFYAIPKFGEYNIQKPIGGELRFINEKLPDTKATQFFRLQSNLHKVKVSAKTAESDKYLWCFKHSKTQFEICTTYPTDDLNKMRNANK